MISNFDKKDKIKALQKEFLRFRSTDPQKGIPIAKELLNLAIEDKDKALQSIAYYNIGVCWMHIAKYPEAIENFEHSQLLALEAKDLGQRIKSIVNIASIYSLTNDEENSTIYFAIADKIAIEADKEIRLRYLVNKIPHLLDKKMHKEANELVNQLLEDTEGIKQELLAYVYFIIGECKYQSCQYPQAIENWLYALSKFSGDSGQRYSAMVYGSLSDFFMQILRFPRKSIEYAQRELEININITQFHGQILAHSRLLRSFLDLNEMDNAKKQIDKIIEINDKIKIDLNHVNLIIVQYYLNIGNTELAHKYLMDCKSKSKNKLRIVLEAKYFYMIGQTQKAKDILDRDFNGQEEDLDLDPGLLHDYYEIVYQLCKKLDQPARALFFLEKKNLFDLKLNQIREKSLILEMDMELQNAFNANQIEKLQLEKKHLDSLNNSLELFAFNAAHDLKEPVRSIMAFAKLLNDREGSLENESKKFLEIIGDSSLRMQGLIDDLLSFAKIGNGLDPFVEVSIREILKHVKNDLNILIMENEAVIEIQGEELMKASPGLIKLVFQNLISNAIKHNSNDQNLIIKIESFRDKQDNLIIKVNDNGSGIAENFIDKVFIPFSKNNARGSGLGLAICRKIVNLHNGEISVESQLGKGTTFKMVFSPECISV